MEPEIIDTDVHAKVDVQCGNHIYGQYIADKIENLIKKHGSIKTDEILGSINGDVLYSFEEYQSMKDKVELLESEVEELEEASDPNYLYDGVSVNVTIVSENAIVAEWAAEEVTRIIKTHGTVKAYEIFKSI